MPAPARTVGASRRRAHRLLGGAVAAAVGLTLSGCLIDRLPAADVAIQRDGDGIRVAFCESVRVDELWVDQWDSKRVEVWDAAPRVRVGVGDVLDRGAMGTSLHELTEFDFESGGDISVTIVRPTDTSQETRFSTRNGVPDDRWLLPGGETAEEPCADSRG